MVSNEMDANTITTDYCVLDGFWVRRAFHERPMLDCQCGHAQVDSYVSDAVRLHVPEVTLDARTWSLMASRSTSSTVTELKPDVFVQVSMNEVNKERRLRR